MSYPKQSGSLIPRPRIENQTSKKTSDLIGRTVNERSISTVLFVCFFVCLKEKLSPIISICSHIARGFEGEKNNDFCAWVRVRFQKKSLTRFRVFTPLNHETVVFYHTQSEANSLVRRVSRQNFGLPEAPLGTEVA